MDKFVIHSFEHVGRDESFWFSILQLSNVTIAFLPPSVTSVIRPLNQGVIVS